MGDSVHVAPGNVEELGTWVRNHTGLILPRHAVCANHQAPMEYLRRAFFEPASDLVVWAPRGGGKTRLGALATLLDLLFKQQCQVRILGGSLEQSLRMWEHLWPDVSGKLAALLPKGRQRWGQIQLTNHNGVAVVPQSQRAVRGLRVQKLRCDEVELFDPDVWEAAQLITRSNDAGVTGTVEALSTLHRPYGLMRRVVERAEAAGTPVIRWCLLEVLERCEPERDCASCPLWDDCQGVAKQRCEGFVRIDDAIAMKRRVSLETWQAEMLCRRPSLSNAVFPSFDDALHLREDLDVPGTRWWAIDFGFANPFVCLWIIDGEDGVVRVVDEYVQTGRRLEEHITHLRSRPLGKPDRVACDPAGNGRNDQTAASDVEVLKSAGLLVRTRSSRIADGVELIRAALRSASGQVRLLVHPRCARLREALRCYRYDEAGGEIPVKDGRHDHLIDALRYFFVNRNAAPIKTGVY